MVFLHRLNYYYYLQTFSAIRQSSVFFPQLVGTVPCRDMVCSYWLLAISYPTTFCLIVCLVSQFGSRLYGFIVLSYIAFSLIIFKDYFDFLCFVLFLIFIIWYLPTCLLDFCHLLYSLILVMIHRFS